LPDATLSPAWPESTLGGHPDRDVAWHLGVKPPLCPPRSAVIAWVTLAAAGRTVGFLLAKDPSGDMQRRLTAARYEVATAVLVVSILQGAWPSLLAERLRCNVGP
jgi:hypothetical protein